MGFDHCSAERRSGMQRPFASETKNPDCRWPICQSVYRRDSFFASSRRRWSQLLQLFAVEERIRTAGQSQNSFCRTDCPAGGINDRRGEWKYICQRSWRCAEYEFNADRRFDSGAGRRNYNDWSRRASKPGTNHRRSSVKKYSWSSITVPPFAGSFTAHRVSGIASSDAAPGADTLNWSCAIQLSPERVIKLRHFQGIVSAMRGRKLRPLCAKTSRLANNPDAVPG